MCNDLPSQPSPRPLRVLLVTSWNTPCGIAEHARLLKASVEKADRKIEILPGSEWLDPEALKARIDWTQENGRNTLVHLNHHDGLHSRWTPEHVWDLRNRGLEVVVTYHDTRARIEDCPKLAAFSQVASSTVVHEPVEGLKAIYWRQGVPAPASLPARYHSNYGLYAWRNAERQLFPHPWTAFDQQPVLGTVGFNFPWKNYDRLAQETAAAGWALVILSNNATDEDEARWTAMNSSILVLRGFLPEDQVVGYLAGCDATAFMYECANTGTSGAIRQGIAARKPVIALASCRQFRDLWELDEHRPAWDRAIIWADGWDDLRRHLGEIQPHRFYAPVHRLAHQESWDHLGVNYAKLYRMLAGQ